MAANALTFKNIYDRLIAVAYPTTPDAAQIVDAKGLVNDGYLQFLGEYPWSFCHKAGSGTLFSAVTTGAVTVGGTGNLTLTAAAATFYSTMVGRTITATTSGSSYTITGYTSSTVITVSVDASADDGDTFTIAAGVYGLASGFSSLIEDPVVTSTNGWVLPRLERKSAEWIVEQVQANPNLTQQPRFYAVQPRTFSASVGQQWDMLVFPLPDQAYTLSGRYRFVPDLLSSDNDYPLGGGVHGLTILAAALMQWEQRKGQVDGFHARTYYQTALPRSIRFDREQQPVILGRTPDSSDFRVDFRNATATYNGS